MKKLILFAAFLLSITSLHTQWKESSFGIIDSPILSFGINGTTIYACTDGEGLYYTYNSGKSWTNYDITYLQSYYIHGVAFKGSYIYVATGSGVYLSTNNGTDWNAVNNGFSSTYIQSITIIGNYIFAGTKDNGVYYTIDNGASWHNIINGLTNNNIKCLLVNGNSLIAGTYGGGVFTTTDKGTSWKAANNGLKSMNVMTLALNNNILYAGLDSNGVCFSSDFGTTWTPLDNDFKSLTVNGFGFSGSNIFVGTNTAGVYYSPDNGTTWRTTNTGMAETKVYSFLTDGTSIYAGTLKKVYKGNISDFNAITIQFNNPNPLTLCNGDTVQIVPPKISGGIPPYTYRWSPPSGVSDTTISNPKLFPAGSTIYTLTVKDNGSTTIQTKQAYYSVKVNPKPLTPVISQDIDTLKAGGSYTSYQWYDSVGNLLAQGTDANTFMPQTNGEYYLIAIDNNGCKSDTSNHIKFIRTSIDDPGDITYFSILTNPASNYIEIILSSDIKLEAELTLYNSLGIQIFSKIISTEAKNNRLNINASNYPSGLYFCRFGTSNVSTFRKIIIIK